VLESSYFDAINGSWGGAIADEIKTGTQNALSRCLAILNIDRAIAHFP
jgi:hypothetical protein